MLCLCGQLLFVFLRHVSYDLSLRLHQMLSAALAYAIWRHIPHKSWAPECYALVGAATFLGSSLLQLSLVLYRNNVALSHARISYDCDTIRVRLHLNRPLLVQAGQYINIWLPSASFWSFTQSHPFTVVSWSNEAQTQLDLFIKPRKGFTKELFGLSKYGPTTSIALFSGPHGRALDIGRFENVILLATDFGIAAHLPYLKQLIHHRTNNATRRIHLVWQIETSGKLRARVDLKPQLIVLDVGIAAQELLNDALHEDRTDGEYVCVQDHEILRDLTFS